MILYLYNMFYYDIFNGSVVGSCFMVHEISIILTYLVLGLFLAFTYKVITWLFGVFFR